MKTIKYESLILLILSIIFVALGIVLVTKSGQGSTAIAAVPFVCSLYFPLTFGTCSFLYNVFCMVGQKLLLKDQMPWLDLGLQFIIAIVLGSAIDFWNRSLEGLTPPNLAAQLSFALVGSLVLGVAIYYQLEANLAKNPAEGIVFAIASRLNHPFATVKLCCDISLVLLAAALSFIFFQRIQGIGLATLISALVPSQTIRLVGRLVGE